MIEVIDRIPTYPGRVRLVPVAGQENTYDIVRADVPIEMGTPLNRALFESIRSDILALQASVSNIINEHAYKTTLGSILVGTEFVLYEGGLRVPFIKLTNEYGGTARSLVLRKDVYKIDTLTASGQGSTYKDCKTDVWLNNEADGYLAQLGANVRSAITEVPVEINTAGPYQAMATINRKAFLLSRREYNIYQQREALYEGDVVAYFNGDSKRVAQYNGAAVNHWTRSPIIGEMDSSTCINTVGGNITQIAYSATAGIRPAFTLPSDFEIDVSGLDAMATAEVIG